MGGKPLSGCDDDQQKAPTQCGLGSPVATLTKGHCQTPLSDSPSTNEASLARVAVTRPSLRGAILGARPSGENHALGKIASIASVVLAIAGSNAGMHLAVAPATTTYRVCLDTQGADSRECQVILRRDWATHSGDRLSDAALIGLAPIPVGWLAAWLFVRRSRPREPMAGITLATKSPALTAH